MTPAVPNAALRFVRALAPGVPPSDGDLLARYLADRDEAAFTELVARHGGAVVGVCRRVLRSDADADDAAQAAFLVLVRRARDFTGRATVGDFLHGVALRTALKLRARAARRRAVEAAAARPEGAVPRPCDDDRAAVDRAVRALPGKLREAVVLCELEGVSRPDAAARLGVPPGTLASRLAAARVKLARRLGPSLAVLAAAGSAESGRAVEVLRSLPVAGSVPASLAAEVMRMVLLDKLKVAVAGLALAVGVTGAGVALTRSATADDPKPPAKAADPAKPPAVARKPAAAKRLALDADDIAGATFLDVYKFEVRFPKGQKFRVVLDESPRPKGSPAWHGQNYSFEQTGDEPAVIRISFIRKDGLFQSFLCGTYDEASIRVDCSGGAVGGITTVVSLPLDDLPPTRRILIHRPGLADGKLARLKGVPLLVLVGLDEKRQPTDRRAEVYVEPVD